MGKRTAEDAAAELENMIREANGVLKDLRKATKEGKSAIEDDLQARFDIEMKSLREASEQQIDHFTKAVAAFTDAIKDQIEKRLGVISAMCGADDRAVQFVAIEVLRGNGGTVNVPQGLRYHLVREKDTPEGPVFGFPEGTAARVNADPRIEAAAIAAVERFRPTLTAFAWKDKPREDM